MLRHLLSVFLILWLPVSSIAGETLHLAVASNFIEPAEALAGQFEQATSHKLILSPGSTGKHYAQIKHGAPFDIFFAADAERPLLLEQAGLALPGTRFTYAIGRLVLWSPQPGYVDSEARVLERADFRYLAIANPRHAPYGTAAEEVLQKRGLWKTLQKKLVRGENIAQTYQYVISGNAQLGFVAYAQIKRPDEPAVGSFWEVPAHLYTPIRQQAVLLRESPAARAFLDFVRSPQARQIIHAYGYDTETN